MVRYLLQQKNPASHYVYIDLMIENIRQDSVELQLAAWRPGRYELGNFAKNIKRVDVFNEKNQPVSFTKLSKDLWKVDSKGCSSLKVSYSYYSAELNAGACYADTRQVYMNPVHCCMCVKGRENEEHIIELNVPDHYRIVSSMKQSGKTLIAAGYEELADSPFFAAEKIHSFSYRVNHVAFHLHFVGECRPNEENFKKDFCAFTKKQIEFWGDFPVNEYHFLFQVMPQKFYHGVEHQKNTVIAIGPGYALNTAKTYEDVLGVSCHELFHTWNIKFIRPAEMLPYDYTKENYARTGYVYEGFTTYYGDKLLFSSDVFSEKQYFETLEERLLKHFHGFGRYNLSVADSSWETWLDGYVPGAPYRKTNIYDEGNLIAFILDIKIMRATQNKKRLRDVCVLMYERFGKKKKGYEEKDILELCNEVSGASLDAFFHDYVYAPNDYEIPLKEALDYIGIELVKEKNISASEHYFGFKITEGAAGTKTGTVAPYSPSWKAGLFSGDDILAVNGIAVRQNLNPWLEYFIEENEIILTVSSADQVKEVFLQKDKKGNAWFFHPRLKRLSDMRQDQKNNFNSWKLF